MTPNFIVLAACSLIPFLVGFLWYHPSLFGGATWSRVADLSAEKAETGVKPIKLLLSLPLNFLLAFGIYNLAVHESGVFGMVGADVEAMTSGTVGAFLAEYGQRFHTFGHGIAHGAIHTVLVFILPILGYVAIFEKKSAKYLLINLGFWIISAGLMGGVICAWGVQVL